MYNVKIKFSYLKELSLQKWLHLQDVGFVTKHLQHKKQNKNITTQHLSTDICHSNDIEQTRIRRQAIV